MKHILLRALILILILILIFATVGTVAFFAAGEKTPTIGFDSAEAEKGETVSLQLTLKNNPGIAGLLVSLKYDTTALTLTETKKGTLFSGFTAAKNFVWDGSKDVTKDGVLATFTFTVAENAAPGEYEIEVIVRESINENYDAVELSVQNGKIVVKGEPVHTETSGACGANLTWAFDLTSGVLTISGSGDMYDYTSSGTAPWCSNKDSIKTVVISEGVTSIGDYAFSSCDKITAIHYEGQKSSWDKIKVGEGNESVANADIVFASCDTHTYDNACDDKCNTCGYIRTITHSYKDKWSSNSSSHYHECSVCKAKKDEAKHIPGPAATETTPQKCTVCEYVLSDASGHVHTYDDVWDKDENGHWNTCTSCEEKSSSEAHIFDNACDTSCNTCGYVRNITHTYKSDYTSDEDGHWHVCEVCENASEKSTHVYDNTCDDDCNDCGYTREVEHVYDNGTVVTEPTKDTVGKKVYKCTLCDAEKITELDAYGSETEVDNTKDNSTSVIVISVISAVAGVILCAVIIYFIRKKKA